MVLWFFCTNPYSVERTERGNWVLPIYNILFSILLINKTINHILHQHSLITNDLQNMVSVWFYGFSDYAPLSLRSSASNLASFSSRSICLSTYASILSVSADRITSEILLFSPFATMQS